MKPGVFHARLAASTEIAAGVCLALGLFTPFAAAGFVALMFVAAWTVHRPTASSSSRRAGSTTWCWPPRRSSLGALGAGQLSLDRVALPRHRPLRATARLVGSGDRAGTGTGRLESLNWRSSTARPPTGVCPDSRSKTSLLALMGFLKQEVPVVDFEEWSKGTRAREDQADGQALGRGRLRHPGGAAPVLCASRSVSTSCRRAVRAGHQGHRRLEQYRAVVDRADRLPEGRALHHAVRGRRPRLRLRPAEQPVLPADGIDAVLVAAQHHPAAAVAEPGPADQGR